MTVDNVTQVLNKIYLQGDKWEEVVGGLGGLDIPGPVLQLNDVQRENHAWAADCNYVNYHPLASWEHLTQKLYYKKMFAAAKESKSFMSTGKCMVSGLSFYDLICVGSTSS
jgi:hypothetical protein